MTPTNVTCNGANDGKITITSPSGGSGSWEISRGNGWVTISASDPYTFTALPAATYTVSIRDKAYPSCEKTLGNITILQPNSLTVSSPTITGPKCYGGNDGSIILGVVSGGTKPYSYLWSNGQTTANISGLITGTYSVTITDANNCFTTASYFVPQPSEITAGNATSTPTTTFGTATGTATAPNPSGGTSPYFYSWNTSPAQITKTATDLLAGTYSVTISDNNGCFITRSVIVYDALEATISAVSVCEDKNDQIRTSSFSAVDVRGGSGSYVPYIWNFGAYASPATATGIGPHRVTYSETGEKTITLTVTDSNNTTVVVTIPHYVGFCFEKKCPPNDFKITDFFLADQSGNLINTQNCGSTSTPAIWIHYDKPPKRYALYVEYRIRITDPATGVSNVFSGVQCNYDDILEYPEGIPSPGRLVNLPDWKCGDIIKIESVFITADNSGNNPKCSSNNKCYTPPDFVDVPIPLFASDVYTNVSCYGGNNGSIRVTASGGKTIYQYSIKNDLDQNWSPWQTSNIFNNLTAGTYTVKIQDSSTPFQEYTVSATITQPSTALTLTEGTTVNPTCHGDATGSTQVTISGGTPDYRFGWNEDPAIIGKSASISGLEGDKIYRLNVLDAKNCPASIDISIVSPPKLHYQTDQGGERWDGNWTDHTSWEKRREEDTEWTPAQCIPNSRNSLSIRIRNGHHVSINSSDNIDVARMTIDPGGMLTVNGTITNVGNESDLIINSNSTISPGNGYGSMIVNGQFSGKLTYNLYSKSSSDYYGNGRYYILSSPVSDQSSSALRATGLSGIAPYNESANGWGGEITENLSPGIGYAILKSSESDIHFTGSPNFGDFPVNVSSMVARYGWNSVGNPYTSAINVKNGLNNFIQQNNSALHPGYGAIYLWNEDLGNFDVMNLSQYYISWYSDAYWGAGINYTTDEIVQAGQGFLVNIVYPNTDNKPIQFTKSMQLHNSGMALKNAHRGLGITLIAENGTLKDKTIVAFSEKGTPGLDPGYDAGTLPVNPFQLYTRFPAGGYDLDLAIQTLPEDRYDEFSIPVGVEAPDGGKITFRAIGVSLPQGIYPVLQDRVLNIQTILKSENDTYSAALPKNTSGSGRFFLSFGTITSSGSLSNFEVTYSAVFKDQKIQVYSNKPDKAIAVLFDINGRKMFEYPLHNENLNEIPAGTLVSGVYLLQIKGHNGNQVIKIPIVKE